MNLNLEKGLERSEKAAVRTLLELSQKENLFEKDPEHPGLDSWVMQKKPLPVEKSINLIASLQRPLSALGKPPRTQRIPLRPLVHKSETTRIEQKNLFLPVVSPVPPHNPQLTTMKPPILKIRSQSLKQRKSSEALYIIHDIDIHFRRKMKKYKIFKENYSQDRPEGLKLITMPRQCKKY